MKKRCKFIVLLSAVLVSISLLTACGEENQTSSNSDKKESSVTTSQTEINSEKNASNTADDESKVSAPEESSVESIETENSVESSEQNSDNSKNSQSSVSSEQTSDENSEPAYYFDDEQIVEDYHTAKEFTDDAEFNKLFASNSIDTAYNKELQGAGTITEMRKITISYAEKWQSEADKAYKALSEKLSDNAEAKTALEKSQKEWIDGLEKIKNDFYAEASSGEGGSETLLNADTAIMNYYKGRAAILYDQIYKLTGNFDM